jgi:hypothetical protein
MIRPLILIAESWRTGAPRLCRKLDLAQSARLDVVGHQSLYSMKYNDVTHSQVNACQRISVPRHATARTDVSSFNANIRRSDDGCTAFWGMKKMDYVKFGKTGLGVSRLCVGCMTYGIPSALSLKLTADEVAALERPYVPRGVSGL